MEIRLNNNVIGSASVTTVGLYASIKCTCHFPDEKMYAIYLSDGAQDRLLGTCTPKGACHVLETKIPKKHISGNSKLYAAEKYADTNAKGIFLVPGKPIATVDKLDKSFLKIINGKLCLIVADEA